ncbi:hypothetical protein GQX74_011657 [Glossina fuscipes]|nr:hypothetical protein GQX74_011657 [Glossina fuscipes]
MILQYLPNITKALPNKPAKPIIPKNMGTIAEMIRSKGHVSSSYSYSKSISNKLSDGVFVPLYPRASFAIEKVRFPQSEAFNPSVHVIFATAGEVHNVVQFIPSDIFTDKPNKIVRSGSFATAFLEKNV